MAPIARNSPHKSTGADSPPRSKFQTRHGVGFCGLQGREVKIASEVRMCRNIKNLFNFEPPVTEDEVRAASLQFVRKITGFNKPSKANEDAFNAAIGEIADVSARLLHSLETTANPKNREEEAAKAK